MAFPGHGLLGQLLKLTTMNLFLAIYCSVHPPLADDNIPE